jgi:1-acyl-sn-glycerol-3-phosphate acyltransferase
MTHELVFRSLSGYGTKIALACGCFPVDLKSPETAIDLSVDVLRTGQVLAVCPEGRSSMDGRLGHFHTGCIRVAQKAELVTGLPTHFVPSRTIYRHHPGSWIRRFPFPVQYLLVTLLFPLYRGGKTVYFGTPFALGDLPDDVQLATLNLRSRVWIAPFTAALQNSGAARRAVR